MTEKQLNRNGDEIEIGQMLLTLWDQKRWIAISTLIVTLIGIVYAFLASPVYYSQATIALKETGKGGNASGLLAQFGGMGGMMASQLGLGNTNLDKMEIVLKGHELAELVITKNGLLPDLFPKLWNPKTKDWISKNPNKIPTSRDGVKLLRENVLVIYLDAKKNVLRIGANIYDSLLAKRVVELYLIELNNKIRMDVQTDAELNREYLEKQLNNTRDPVLMEKVQNMISIEIEKYMLVSNQAFEVLEKPIIPNERSKPKKKLIIVLFFMLGIASSIIGTFIWKSVALSRRAIYQK